MDIFTVDTPAFITHINYSDNILCYSTSKGEFKGNGESRFTAELATSVCSLAVALGSKISSSSSTINVHSHLIHILLSFNQIILSFDVFANAFIHENNISTCFHSSLDSSSTIYHAQYFNQFLALSTPFKIAIFKLDPLPKLIKRILLTEASMACVLLGRGFVYSSNNTVVLMKSLNDDNGHVLTMQSDIVNLVWIQDVCLFNLVAMYNLYR